MAKLKKIQECEPYSIAHVQSEMDAIWVLWNAAQTKDPKLVRQVVSRMRAKLGHMFAPRIFKTILEAKDPFGLIEDITENYLAKPPAAELDLTQHGVCHVRMQTDDAYVSEYIHVHFGEDRADILHAQRYEVLIMENCAIEAVMACGLNYAIVDVTLFKDHGFTGKTHQFVIGDEESAKQLGYTLEDL